MRGEVTLFNIDDTDYAASIFDHRKGLRFEVQSPIEYHLLDQVVGEGVEAKLEELLSHRHLPLPLEAVRVSETYYEGHRPGGRGCLLLWVLCPITIGLSATCALQCCPSPLQVRESYRAIRELIV